MGRPWDKHGLAFGLGHPWGSSDQPGMSMALGMAGEGLATLASFLTVS